MRTNFYSDRNRTQVEKLLKHRLILLVRVSTERLNYIEIVDRLNISDNLAKS